MVKKVKEVENEYTSIKIKTVTYKQLLDITIEIGKGMSEMIEIALDNYIKEENKRIDQFKEKEKNKEEKLENLVKTELGEKEKTSILTKIKKIEKELKELEDKLETTKSFEAIPLRVKIDSLTNELKRLVLDEKLMKTKNLVKKD